jgi:type I restriction enzyme S subunit
MHAQLDTVAFLDRETARIDGLISRKRELRRLIEERLRVAISAMTSLPATARSPLGRYVASIDQGASPVCDAGPAGDTEWGVLKLSAVHRGIFRPGENKAMRPDEPIRREYLLATGDVLVTRANTPDLVGDCCVVKKDTGRILLPDLIFPIRLRSGLEPRFLVYVLLSDPVRGLIESVARGSSQSMVKLRGEDLTALPIPVPGENVQRHIADQLDSLASWTERVTIVLDKQVTALREHRQALITAAVTGQIEVTGKVA